MIARYIATTLLGLPLLLTSLSAQRTPSHPTSKSVEEARLFSPLRRAEHPAYAIPQNYSDAYLGPSRAVSPAIDPRSTGLAKLGPGDSVGFTYYDLATNASMMDRIINWPDEGRPLGTIGSSVVWTAATDLPPATGNYLASNRGTYGANFADGTWLPMGGSWARLEDLRTGFVETAALSDGRIVFAAHSGGMVHCWVELDAGSSQFFQVDITGSEAGLWVSLAVSENDDIHLIWTEQSTPERVAPLHYSRSTDKGNSFTQAVDLNGANSVIVTDLREGFGANSYAIAARGDKVSVWYLTQGIQIFELTSTDKGENWFSDDIVVIEQGQHVRQYYGGDNPDEIMWPDPEVSTDTAFGFRTDTVSSPGSSLDMVMDSEGNTHGVFSLIQTYVRRFYYLGEDSTARNPNTIYGTVTNNTDTGLVYVKHSGELLYRTTIPNAGGLDNTENPDAPNYFIRRAYHAGWAMYPQLGLDGANNVYATFTSGVAGDVQVRKRRPDSTDKEYLNQHVFVTMMRSDDPLLAWTTPRDLTPMGLDAKFGSLADLVDDQLHIAYQIDPIVGEVIVDTLAPLPREKNNIEVMFLPKSSLLSAPLDIESNMLLTAAPNPANGVVTVTYEIERPGRTTLVLVDALGRVARTLLDESDSPRGQRQRAIDLNGMASGVYYLRLSNGGSVTTTAINVAR